MDQQMLKESLASAVTGMREVNRAIAATAAVLRTERVISDLLGYGR
jgi:hypothetical protein